MRFLHCRTISRGRYPPSRPPKKRICWRMYETRPEHQSCYSVSLIRLTTLFYVFRSALTLGCQSWQSRVADLFCYFWVVFSRRTFLTKSVVWKGAQQTLSLPPTAATGLQVRFSLGASTMPRRQPKSVPEFMLSDASTSKPPQSKKARRVVGVWRADLLVGFAADFWAWLVDFGGGRASAEFLFSVGGFSGGYFRRFFFLCILWPNNPLQKSTTSMAAFWKIFHCRLKPRPAVGKFKVQHWYTPWNWNQVCLPNFLPRLRSSWSMATAPLEIPRQA